MYVCETMTLKYAVTDKQIYMQWPCAATHVYQSAEEGESLSVCGTVCVCTTDFTLKTASYQETYI